MVVVLHLRHQGVKVMTSTEPAPRSLEEKMRPEVWHVPRVELDQFVLQPARRAEVQIRAHRKDPLVTHVAEDASSPATDEWAHGRARTGQMDEAVEGKAR